MGKEKHLSDEELMALASAEFVEVVKQFRNGDFNAIEKAKYPDILAKRGLKLGVTRDFIHRIFTGEFDNADAVNVKTIKVWSK